MLISYLNQVFTKWNSKLVELDLKENNDWIKKNMQDQRHIVHNFKERTGVTLGRNRKWLAFASNFKYILGTLHLFYSSLSG